MYHWFGCLVGVNVIINKLTLIPSEKETRTGIKRNSQAVNNCFVNYYYSLKIILNTLQICCANQHTKRYQRIILNYIFS